MKIKKNYHYIFSDCRSAIGFAWLPYSLTKGGQHHITINYTRAIEDEPYLGDLSFTTYGGTFLDYTDPSSWFSKYKLGLLKIYIDDMDRSVLQVPINLGSSVATDNLASINPSSGTADGTMAAKSYITLSATTSNTTSQSAAFQILDWNFNEGPKCRITSLDWFKGKDITNSKVLSTINLKNIGKEILFLKVIYTTTYLTEYDLDQERWSEWRDSNGDIKPAFIDYSFYNGFLDGWEFQLNIDNTIQDVVVHNHLNESYSSVNIFFEIITNPHIMNSTLDVWMRTNNGDVEMGYCGCAPWLDVLDELGLYNLGMQSYCQNKYLSNSRWFWFEASKTDANNENLVFQNHTIWNECAFDSQCSWFLPGASWIPSGILWFNILNNQIITPDILLYL